MYMKLYFSLLLGFSTLYSMIVEIMARSIIPRKNALKRINIVIEMIFLYNQSVYPPIIVEVGKLLIGSSSLT